MNQAFYRFKPFALVGIPLFLFGAIIVLIYLLPINSINRLSLAISIDLLVVIPAIYFLLIRRTKVPNTTVIPLMLFGLVIGSYFLPSHNQAYLEFFKTWALPLIEVAVLIYVSLKVHAAIKKYKATSNTTLDFFSALKDTCREILPKPLVMPFATEVAVIYYGLLNWKTRALKPNEFTYHKQSGTPALFGAFIFIIGIETFALHFLLAQWSAVFAWVLTGLSLYTAMQVLGFARSLAQRPIAITDEHLSLQYGIMNEVSITLSDIESITLSKRPLKKGEGVIKLSPLGELESHNVVLSLKEEYVLFGLYGMKKRFKTLALHLDEPNAFLQKLERNSE